jgi:hypothetical protein
MKLEFDPDKHEFFVDTPDWKTTVKVGDKFAFIVNSDLNDLQMKSLATIAESGGLFGNIVTGDAISFDVSSTAFVSAKQMPVASPQALQAVFDFGIVQSIRQSDLHLEYWGLDAKQGVVVVHTNLSRRDEVDTSDATKPFTRLASNRCKVAVIKSTRPGFHAFRLHAKHGDHPQFIVNRFQSAQGAHDLLARQMLLRSVDCQLDFSTIFCFREKKSGKFEGITSCDWRIRWKHVLSYEEKAVPGGGMEYVPKDAVGPARSDLLPSSGNAANVDQHARDMLAIAQAGGPFLTPDVLNARMRSSTGVTKTESDDNPDFDKSFIKRLRP